MPKPERIPPQAVEVEQSVLGAMLIEKEAVATAIEILDKDTFYRDAHAQIFEAITSLFDRSEPADVTTVSEELRKRGELDRIGGAYYLTELTMKVTSTSNVEAHAYIVLEKAILRKLIEVSNDISNRSYAEVEDPIELLDSAEQQIFKVAQRRLKRSAVGLPKAFADTYELLEKMQSNHSGIIGVPSGFIKLDNLTGGFQKSDLIVIAGRTSQGKTALSLSIALHAAIAKDTPIGIFSLEMSTQQLTMRCIASQAIVDAHSLRTGRLTQDDWKRISSRCDKLSTAPIFIDDTPSLGILEVRAKSRRMKAEKNIGMVIIDYLQLMQGPKGAENREKEIAAISRSMKGLAKELDIPVVLLSQLNRAVESRGNKRPLLSDLRESGAIEENADVVIFVYRPEFYGDVLMDDGKTSSSNLAEITIGKQRSGPTGSFYLTFLKESTRFDNYASEYQGSPVSPSRFSHNDLYETEEEAF
jgi:replicative DNA helicase